METNQSQSQSKEAAEPAAAESSPMYWPEGTADEGKDGDPNEPYDSLFDVTSVWD